MWDQLDDAIKHSNIPEHLRAGLVRYFSDGIIPGGFLQAVLVNDLPLAVARHAGGGAAFTITVLRQFLTDYAPPESWGSYANVRAWTTTPDRLEVSPPPEVIDMAVDMDGNPLPFSPAAVRAMVLEMLDEGTLLAFVVQRGDDIGVQVVGPPSMALVELMEQAVSGLRKVVEGQ